MEQAHIEALEASDKKIRARLVASLAVFAVFLALNVAAALTHKLGDWGLVLLAALITAIALLPRDPVPAGVSFDESPEGRRWLERTVRARIYLGYTRAAMFILSLAVLFGLPKVVG